VLLTPFAMCKLHNICEIKMNLEECCFKSFEIKKKLAILFDKINFIGSVIKRNGDDQD
jgi:hypothetical protein